MWFSAKRSVAAIGAAFLSVPGWLARAEEQPRLVELSAAHAELRAFVAPSHGGDLASLQYRRNGTWVELLYRGMDYRPTTGWTGKAPILWPAVGRNFLAANSDDLGWVSHGAIFPIGIHGFARDQEWQVGEEAGCDERTAKIRLLLRDNPETRSVYPFGFLLTTDYVLSGTSLFILQTVTADPANADRMPFSIGNHITFKIPLAPGGSSERTTISTPATRQVLTDESGRPSGEVAEADFAEPRPLSTLPPLRAISLSGYAGDWAWARIEDPSSLTVTVSHREDRRPDGNPVLFNLWGDIRQGFFAPEPWVGKQNSLSTGDGAISLAPGESYRWTIAIRIAETGGAIAPPEIPMHECRLKKGDAG